MLPIGSMGLVYLPTFTTKINHSCRKMVILEEVLCFNMQGIVPTGSMYMVYLPALKVNFYGPMVSKCSPVPKKKGTWALVSSADLNDR